jgi:hypothetical protein
VLVLRGKSERRASLAAGGTVDDGIAVRVTRESHLEWQVWLNERVAARFAVLTDALDYAELLTCSPRARAEVVGSPQRPITT